MFVSELSTHKHLVWVLPFYCTTLNEEIKLHLIVISPKVHITGKVIKMLSTLLTSQPESGRPQLEDTGDFLFIFVNSAPSVNSVTV